MHIIKPPHPLTQAKTFTVFLAGSIEMGLAEDWQTIIENGLEALENICVLNPRRDDWDSSWEQRKTNPAFYEQVNWELSGLERADVILFYFSPETKSPVSMLELGLFAQSGKAVVCCPEGFWRKGNIDIVCERFNIPQKNTIHELITYLKQKYHENESPHVD